MANNKLPLFFTIGLTIVISVVFATILQSYYDYTRTTKEITIEMKNKMEITSINIQKNLGSYIESYSVNEYDNLILNEMGQADILAIVVDDYNMGKITGEESYISGKIRDAKWDTKDYIPNNVEHNKKLESAFFVQKKEILDTKGSNVGTITIYASDILLKKKINNIIIHNVLTSLILIILLSITLFLIVNLFILKPLSKIIKTIENADEEGIPKKYMPQDNSEEISLLSTAMNKMLDTIKQSRKKLIEQENTLTYQANYDELTGLPNRNLFQERLEKGLLKAKDSNKKLALLYVDLDHFKEINDSYGHEIGDEVLNIITQRLKDVVQTTDVLARFGGDEFTVILENFTDIEEASTLAEDILSALVKPVSIRNNSLYVSSSIGISLFPNDGDTFQDLLKFADAAVNKAKSDGRSNYQFYDAKMTELAFEKIEMEAGFRESLENEDFVVYYQPQVDARSGKLVGMEALVRWNHPISGLIPPYKFIPLAESTGLIVELDRYVMKTAMIQLVRWYKDGFNPGRLAMNLAVKQFQQKDFIQMLEALIEETDCKPEWIELEVTESQIMTNPEEAIKILTKISDLGIELAVDDFGTGYSSLAYLKRLPINKLKIDQLFIRDLPSDEDDAKITRAVIALSKSLNLRTIAEGVETIEQKEFLIENGCNYIQGYYYSKPVPADEIEDILTNGFNI